MVFVNQFCFINNNIFNQNNVFKYISFYLLFLKLRERTRTTWPFEGGSLESLQLGRKRLWIKKKIWLFTITQICYMLGKLLYYDIMAKFPIQVSNTYEIKEVLLIIMLPLLYFFTDLLPKISKKMLMEYVDIMFLYSESYLFSLLI